MDLIAIAIGPGLAICLFIFHRDAFNKEPKQSLLIAFALGGATILPVFYVEKAIQKAAVTPDVGGIVILAFVVAALTEEVFKFLVLRYYAYPLKNFDEPLDGIVYSVVIAMGFATVENVKYVFFAEEGKGLSTGIARMFTAVPAHATFGVLMGYFAGKAKFDAPNAQRLLLTGVFWAVIFHGFYDFFLFLPLLPDFREDTVRVMLFLGALASFGVAIWLSFKHIKTHRLLSMTTYRPNLTISLRRAFPGDIPLIRDLTYKIWPQTYASILSKEQMDYMLNMMYSEASLQEQMKNNHEFNIIYDGVEPVGFASYSLAEPQVFKLHKIYILPNQQGKGSGRFVIEELIRTIKPWGATRLRLNVNRHNNAKDFYEKLGFKVTREENVDIGNGFFMNDYVMEREL